MTKAKETQETHDQERKPTLQELIEESNPQVKDYITQLYNANVTLKNKLQIIASTCGL